ncbi:glycosyltransferase [uncultured Ramlibacter sp.]|uniref:glycosyltransferase n=1 Tax=uncultured Ramlibacter sp. TaxID=260755 RepID=UPI002630E9E4|nr:glycosyltransferase [uncultured Ramlibacter sp.]
MQRILFIHQNFPGQFVHVAQELARQGAEVVALGIEGRPVPGVKFLRYQVSVPAQASQVPGVADFEVKVLRGRACLAAMAKLKAGGFRPDLIVADPGWGEALFCKDAWPAVRLVMFAEFFYQAEGADCSFDPQLSTDTLEGRARLRLKNTVHLHALAAADAIYTPTHWQKKQLPPQYQKKTAVIFDGIDTDLVKPDAGAFITLQRDNLTLKAGDEVLTFVNRNLEPYRGFHAFMRALPEILAQRPKARCLIVGEDSVSYGAPPAAGGTWRQAMLKEVGGRLPLERVHFLGRLKYADYLRVLQVSACHVYLTYPFVLSWSCLEAMSAGCTVLASATAPVKEVIKDGENGLLFNFFDTQELVRKAIGILDGSAAQKSIGKNARQTVVDSYDLRTVCLPRQQEFLQQAIQA